MQGGLGVRIASILARHPRRVALARQTRYRIFPATYAELDLRVQGCRRMLAARGVKEGERALILGRNSVEWAAAWLACVESGVIAVPLDPRSDELFLGKVAEQTKPALLFCDQPRADWRGRTLLLPDLARPPAASEDLPLARAAPDALLEIMYTSGTTGEPKGVILTHGNIEASLNGALRTAPLPFPIHFLSTLPLSHMLEQILGLLYPLAQGCRVIYPQTTLPSRLVRAIRRCGVHAMITAPGLLAAMRDALKHGAEGPRRALGARFRLVGVGGASLPLELEDWWSALGVRVVQGYGLTEAAPLIALNTPWRKRRGSVGRALPGVRLRVASDGEIQAKGGNTTPGYYGRRVEDLYTPDGWLKTGDVGELRRGWLYFRGREKDVIVTSGGANVYPEDVEAALNALRGVEDSCVLERRDKVWAVLRLSEQLDPREIIAQANAALMPHQRIAGATLWPRPDFPRTALGKIRKPEVLAALEALEKKPPPKAPAAEGCALEPVIRRALGAEKIDPDAKLADLGMDSLARMGLISQIEAELGVPLEETAVTESTTVGELEALIASTPKLEATRLPRWQFGRVAGVFRPPLAWLSERLVAAIARPEILGLERLDGLAGPAIFAVNHQSAWDGALVSLCLPRRFKRCAMPALPDFFGLPTDPRDRRRLRQLGFRAMGLFIAEAFRCYPFGPSAGTERSLELTGELLDRGLSIVIFPEGGRTRDGAIHPFMAGVGVLAAEMQAPVVPVKVSGMREILPFPRFFIPRRIGGARVSFGQPLPPQSGPPDASARRIQQAVESLP